MFHSTLRVTFLVVVGILAYYSFSVIFENPFIPVDSSADTSVSQMEYNRRSEELINTQIQLQPENTFNYFDDIGSWEAYIRDEYDYGEN